MLRDLPDIPFPERRVRCCQPPRRPCCSADFGLILFKRLTKSASKQTQADLAKKAEIKERKTQKILEDNEEWELKSCGGFTRIYPSLEKAGFRNVQCFIGLRLVGKNFPT